MNDYIVNPSFFYWAHVVDALIFAMIFIGIFGSLASIIWAVSLWEDAQKITKAMVALVISVLLCLSAAFVPTKKTMIEMEIARNATKSNVTEMKEDAKCVVDYIFEKIEKMDK